MTRSVNRTVFQAASLFGLLLCIAAAVWAWNAGLLTSQERMQAFVASCGAAGGLLFVAFQAVQVVVPVLPGGLGCLAGVVLFGPALGFVYNYVGICIGSLLAFAVARSCGRPLLRLLFSEKLLTKYSSWTEQNNRFARLFALAIFFPVAPDDFLCYLAGTTSMTWRRFTAIILLGKPLSIALYSLGLTVLFQQIVGWLA
ncbi:VTT domain-containing protein [uncultured Oscillibacter sp.]|uniref:TVP38/TMEM64 family protein n=1 Tax=uncultured Oscillibacter sp. TaxID=876091 RepID=UPI002804B002|nr:VTT domain-containing protein [uncultured Oscillibacter sp.]